MYKLDYYINKFGNLHIQGSTQWLKGRSSCFGGSEMATLLGESKHENWETLKKKKINQYVDTCDTTEWGHWFEPVSKFYIEKDYGPIYEFGSIPHTYYPVCYSPDGIIVENNDLTLLEIKNPVMRSINKIPPHYLPQVKTGMCVINVKYTLFAQFRFRRCPLDTPPENYIYDRNYHKEYRNRQKDQKPFSWGYLYWPGENKLVDLGKCKNMCDKLGTRCSKPPQIYIETHYKPEKGFILMWKLFEYVYAGIPPDYNYLSDKEEQLWKKYNELYNAKVNAYKPIKEIHCDSSDSDDAPIYIVKQLDKYRFNKKK